MRTPRYFFTILCFACGNSIHAQQKDSSFTGFTIHIAKPDIKAHVEVSEEYAVFLKQSEAPKLGKISGSKLKYIKSKDLRSFGQNEEKPMPLVSASYYRKNKQGDTMRLVYPSDQYDDGWAITKLGDTLADLSTYLEDTTHFTFPSKNSHRIDTIQLKVMLDKKGKYHYSFASKQDSLNEGGAKCMEALTSIRKWQPAHIFRERHHFFDTGKGGQRKRSPKRIKAYSEILITVVLSPFSLTEGEESTEK